MSVLILFKFDNLFITNKLDKINKIYLIEPSSIATSRAYNIINSQFDKYRIEKPKIIIYNQFFNETNIRQFEEVSSNFHINLFLLICLKIIT